MGYRREDNNSLARRLIHKNNLPPTKTGQRHPKQLPLSMRKTLIRKKHIQPTSALNSRPKTHRSQPLNDILIIRNSVDLCIFPDIDG